MVEKQGELCVASLCSPLLQPLNDGGHCSPQGEGTPHQEEKVLYAVLYPVIRGSCPLGQGESTLSSLSHYLLVT